MPDLRVADLVEATGGELLRGDAQACLGAYEIDTRRLQRDSAFFALRGERTDGHRFLGEALTGGAVAAVIQQEPEADEPSPPALIRVDDTTRALADCGRWVRRRLSRTRWIAVTGSNGKTTTKELIASGLATDHRVHRTPGNFNNHLGVPLSLLACPADAEYAVLELGMSAYGEIAELTGMTDPDIGLVTNVRAAHLEHFGSLDDIAAAKGEMFAVLRDDAVSVVNLDDTHVRVQATRHAGPRVTFGQHGSADVRLEDLVNRFDPGAELVVGHQGRSHRIRLRLGGGHAAFDALAALATIVATGESIESAIPGLERVEPGAGRGRIHRMPDGCMLVDDSYNSSPSALASVLETLRLSTPPGRKVLVMGDMLELGPVEGALHREAGKRAAAAGVNVLFGVGPLSRASVETAHRSGVEEVHHYPDAQRAAESIGEFLRPGDLIVVKGSRGMRLERVVDALVARTEGAV